VEAISPLSLAFLRFGVVTILLLIIFKIRKLNFRIDKKDYFLFFVLGALIIPVNQLFFLQGINLSEASHSGALYSCTPLIIYLISIKLKNEVFDVKKLMSIILTVVGILIIFYENIMAPKVPGENYLLGDILLFLAVCSWSFYLALSQNIVNKYGALKSQTIAFIIGTLLYIPIFLIDLKNLTFVRVNIYVILGYIHLTVLVAFGSYFLYSYSAKVIKPSTLTTLTNTSPVVTILFSWLLLNENLSYFFILGSVLIMTGVYFTQRIKDDNLPQSLKENGSVGG
jgi:drug/metabolite transporter (DMT)-like permease